MKGSEDTKIIIRGVEKKLLETLLLVLGLAFGIGAAAAGIALAARSVTASKEELASPGYREILVATREESEEMDVPLLLRETRNRTVLTSIDLKAAQEAPDVAYSYVKSNERFFNMATMIRQFQQRQTQSGSQAQTGAQTQSGAQAQSGQAQGSANAQGAANAQVIQQGGNMMVFMGPGPGGPEGPAPADRPPEGVSPEAQSAGGSTQAAEGTQQARAGTQAAGTSNRRAGQTAGTAQAAGAEGTRAQGTAGAAQTSGETVPANAQTGTAAASAQGNSQTAANRQNRQQGPDPFDFSQIDLSGPQPALEEWYGYQVTPEYFPAWNLEAKSGSLFTVQDIKNGSNPMILGAGLAKTLYEDGEALGRKPMSGRTIYTVTGILEPTGTILDNLAFVPAFMPDVQGNIQEGGFFRGGWNSTLSFMVKEPDRLDEAADQLRAYFTRTYGEGNFIMTIPREEAQATRDRNERTVTLILFLALTGLFIAGVNVSNTLLSHAMKRQKTVGVLKALGASKNRIFRLFLTEAFITGTLGTIVGTGFSILLSWLIARSTNLTGTRPLELALGILLAWVISSALIIFPSMQAARIPAAEAMRTE